MRMSSSCREHRCEVILNAFWRPSGRIFRPFWAHVELKSRLGGSLTALLRLEGHFPGSTPTILELLEAFGGGFWRYVGIVLRYSFHEEFYMFKA